MDERFMRRAIALSRDNMLKGLGGPFGAIVVMNGEVVAEGWNQVTSTNDPTAHAEVVAIREACRKLGTFSLAGAELYTSCEPCPMCLASAYWARVASIAFAGTREDAALSGFDDDFLYRELPKPLEERTVPMVPLLRDEARAVFREWDLKPDKIPY